MLVCCACRRSAHIAYLQIFDEHHRVVLAERSRGFVQEIAAVIGDLGVDFLDFAIPRSIPTAVFAVEGTISTSRWVWMLMNHLPFLPETVTFLSSPNTSRLLR